MLRDFDLLIELRKDNLISIAFSITTLNEETRRILEPRTSSINNKLRCMKILSENNIPVFGMIAPIIPAINSHEIFSLAKQFYINWAFGFSHAIVRLNDAVEPIFTQWARFYFPNKAEKILNQIKELHRGNLGSKVPMDRMRGSENLAFAINQSAKIAKQNLFPNFVYPTLNTSAFIRKHNLQLSFFD